MFTIYLFIYSNHAFSTEGGVLMGSTRDMATDKEWSWLKLNPFFAPYAEWVKQPGASHLCELVVLPGWPSKVFSNRDDGAYATRDLFEQHPTNPEKWRYVGRLDDTIVLVNGEKANPVPLELSIRPSPLVNEVIVAGAERSNLAAVIIARKDLPREEFIEKVWPYVETGNKQVPAYARISKEAILILPAGTDYPRTDKGTPIRQAFLRKFSQEIDHFFDELDSATNDPNSGLELSRDETRAFVREAVENVLGLETKTDKAALEDDTDMFSFGLDSLQAMRLWRKITRELNTGGKKVGQNIAFEKPSIAALSNYLYGLRTGESEQGETAEQKMQRLIEKYSEFPQHLPGDVKVDSEYIVSPLIRYRIEVQVTHRNI
jgi:aryl carrier-like protein